MSIPQRCGRCGKWAFRLYGTSSALLAGLERIRDGQAFGPGEAWICRDCAPPALVREVRGACADHAHDCEGTRCLPGVPYAGDERADGAETMATKRS